MPDKIEKNRVLLVEGKDEVNFFRALLRRMGNPEVQVVEIGGIDKFRTELPAFLNDPGFGRVTHYAVVRDAEKSAKAAFQSVAGVLRKHNQPCPQKPAAFASKSRRKVGVFIMPGRSDHGMLEDLCLQTVAEHPAMECVDEFIRCLRSKLKPFPKNESKARASAFLAGMPETCYRFGEAAQKGYWDLSHPALNDLKAFLSRLSDSSFD
jgi:hypothetical protein